MRNRLSQFLKDNWDAIDVGSAPTTFKFMVVNYSVILVFKERASIPCLIIKTSKEKNLKKEYQSLQYVNSVLPESTPEPYLYDCLSGIHIFVARYLHGKKIIHFKKVESHIHNSFSQLISFHDRVKKDPLLVNDETLTSNFLSPLTQLAKHSNSSLIKRETENLIHEIGELKNHYLPNIPQHGDFSFVNLLFQEQDQRVRIIDWIDYGSTHLPGYDAFSLYISYYFNQNLFTNFLKNTPTHAILLKGIRSYCTHFAIDTRHIPLLLPVMLAHFFNHCYPERTFALKTLIPLIDFYFINKDNWLINTIKL